MTYFDRAQKKLNAGTVHFIRAKRWMTPVIGALVFACMPQSQPVAPEVKNSSTLALAELDTAEPAPFTVVHAAPRGTTTGDPSINLVFSRPLRKLMADMPVPRGLRVSPEVAGHWEWVGVHGLTFVPEAGRLKRATEYRVQVPASLHDISGQPLAESVEFSFQTPVATVEHAQTTSWGRSATPDTPVVLSFSQPVAAAQVAPFIVARVNGGTPELKVRQGKLPNLLIVQSVQGWPLASKIRLEVMPGFPSLEGPLPGRKTFAEEFETYGPLIATVECDRDERRHCRPEGSLTLSLTNPVHAKTLARAIRAEGVKLNVDQDWSDDAETRYISLGAPLKPRQQFTVTVAPIVDVYGQKLSFVRNRQVAVSDLRPSVRIGFSGDALPLAEERVSVLSTNAGYELVTAPLSAEALVALAETPSPKRFAAVAQLPSAKTQRVARGALNAREQTFVSLDPITDHGPFAIAVRYTADGDVQEQVRWGQRTDLGISVKAGRDRSFAWVTRLDSGAPVVGAQVRMLGGQASAATEADGVALLPPGQFLARSDKSGAHQWLEVKLGEQRAYRASGDRVGGWRLGVDHDFHGEPRDSAFLFPERDLFRPGEQAWLKGYVRRPSVAGNAVVQNELFDLQLLSPDGEVVSTTRVTSNRFGAISARLKLPESGQLGYWTAQLKRGDTWLANTQLQVAEFRRAEFEVKVQAKSASVVAGQPVGWAVHGSYFYGGVMSESDLETVTSRRETSFSPPGLDDYSVDDAEWQYYQPYRSISPVLHSGRQTLDALGEFETQTSTLLPQQVGPERIEFEATVSDVSGQTASTRGSALVHAAEHYVAIRRPESSLVDAPGSLSPQIRAVTPNGATVTGRPVTLSLYRLRWTHAKRNSGAQASESVSELVRDLVGSCSLKTATTDQSCPLRVEQPGQYVLRAASVDAKGRSTFSSSSFYAVGAGGVAAWRDLDERGTVELTTDRQMYTPGQIARILVKSPFERARAWVTIEKDGVLSQELVTLSGPSPLIQVKIDERMRPNAYLSVHLLEDRQALGKKAHAISDSYRLGYAELRIDPERQRLSVQANSTKKAYRPGDRVQLDLRVTDVQGTGRTAEVTVFVVDEGVLTLSGYQLPDPLLAFTRPQPLRVETIESRESSARLFGLEPNQDENKGDPGGGGGDDRSLILSSAYFNPSILTSPQGRASVSFELPDNLGRFRIMALAVTDDDRYGKGQGSFTVNRPLMVRPALPRFLRAGDELELSAVVSGLDFPGGDVSVELQTKGLQLLESGKKQLTLEQNGSKLVSFRARAPRVGQTEVRFGARSGQATDSIVLQKAVQSPAQLEAVALYGKTQDAEGHQLGELSGVRKDLGGLDVTLSSSALVGLKGGFEQLWDYPYACSEQLSSRVLPLVMLRDLAQLYGVAPPADAAARIDANLAQLVRRQRGDGGFGMWPESPESSPFVSAYALWVLHEARIRGSVVPEPVFVRGARYLQDLASKRSPETLADATFASFVLSQIGKADQNTQLALLQHVEQMPVESQLFLLWAAASSNTSRVVAALLPRLEGSITRRGNAAEITAPHGENDGFSSDTRRHAIALSALIAAKPQHVLAAPLVRSLLQARGGQGWGNTQESAFALLALDAYRRAQEQTEPQFTALVFLAGELLGQKRFMGRSTEAQDFATAMADLASGGELVFQRQGSGTLFFEARLKYARTKLPQAPLESGFMVQKTMTPLGPGWQKTTGVQKDAHSMAHGDLVLVDLTVLTPSARRFVVVDDPLPAGLEALDLSLNNAQGSLRSLLRPTGGGYGEAWYRSELRDDRVLYFVDNMPPGVYSYRYLARATTRGRFVTPPTRAMEMYQEEVYGRTAARSFVVQ